MADGDQDAICPRSFDCNSPKVSFDIGTSPSYVSLVSAVFTCIGSALLVLAFVVFKDLRKSVAQNIITQLSIADFINAVGVIIGAINFLIHFNSREKDGSKSCEAFETTCMLQSYVTQWAGVTSYVWTSLLAVFLMLKYTCTDRAANIFAKLMPLMTVLIWLFPFIFLLPMLSLRKLGYSRYGASNWCYVSDSEYGSSFKDKSETTALIVFANWIWQLLSMLVVIVSFAAIRVHLYKQRRRYSPQSLSLHLTVETVERRLLLIPIAYIIIHIWDSCQIITSFVLSSEVDSSGCTQSRVQHIFLAFGILQGIGDAAQGWINALLYLFASSKLRKRLFWDQFQKICCKTQTEVQQLCDMENAEIVRDSGVQKMHSKIYSSFETVSLSSVHTGIGAASDN